MSSKLDELASGQAFNVDRSFARWTSLNHALSGLFCASLNFIDSTRTTRPRLIFEREGKESHNTPQNLYLLHGSLPREVVCTENLTPFLKLLPCKGNAGIASLLDGHKLFDASWQSMAIDVRPVCSSKDNAWTIEMEQVVDMVLDTERAKRPRGMFTPEFSRKTTHIQCRQSYPSSYWTRGLTLQPVEVLWR